MDLEGIKQKIKEDKMKRTPSNRRYPVRFLFMELNNETQNDIMDLVQNNNGELLDLSDYIMHKDDGWITKSCFMDVIKEKISKEKDTFVVGFSEMIRFYSKKEIESIVISLFDIENKNIQDARKGERRIYFICFSMSNDVNRVIKKCFSRIEMLDPIISVGQGDYGGYKRLCFVADEYKDKITGNKINTSVEWIGLWRNSSIIDFSKPIYCCSPSLYKWFQKASPDNGFVIDIVHNTKEYFQKVMGCSIDFEYKSSDDKNWKKLLDDFNDNSNRTLKDIMSQRLGINVDKIEFLAGKMVTTDDMYEKWLIENYVKSFFSTSYFNSILGDSGLKNNRMIYSAIWLKGYDISDKRMLEERVVIIKEIKKYASLSIPEKEISQKISKDVSKFLKLEYIEINTKKGIDVDKISEDYKISKQQIENGLSNYISSVFRPSYVGISTTEKEFVINMYSIGVLKSNDIKDMYGSLYSYLYGLGERYVQCDDVYKKYLQEYRKSKVANKDTQYLEDYYTSTHFNAEKVYELYYKLKKQDELVKEINDSDTDVYIIDGLGAEYLPLIVDVFSARSYAVNICEYASAHLPTITDVNKIFLAEIKYKEWILEFDRDVIHGDYYYAYSNLRKAFDIIERIINRIIDESYGKRVIITADHGATARARWIQPEKKYSFSDSDHEGRCCKMKNQNECENNEDYIVFETETESSIKYLVALKEISLFNNPKYEGHGGATLEEMLVPVIEATPQTSKASITYTVSPDKLLVSGLDKKVSFYIHPEAHIVKLIEKNGNEIVMKKEGDKYTAILSVGTVQEIIIQVDSYDYRFITESVSKMNMEGDDGFDD